MCLCTHTSRQRLGSYPLVLHAGYGHRVRQWNTWACGGDSSGRNQRRVTNLAIRMSEHSIIKFHVCSKHRCKRTRHLKMKRKCRPALCVRTTERCCWHQDVGRGDGFTQAGRDESLGHTSASGEEALRWQGGSLLRVVERGDWGGVWHRLAAQEGGPLDRLDEASWRLGIDLGGHIYPDAGAARSWVAVRYCRRSGNDTAGSGAVDPRGSYRHGPAFC